MTTPADHMTIAEIIHDFATRQGDLTDRWAREDLAAILERRMVAERAGVLREAAEDLACCWASAWGDDRAWLTTGTKVAALVADVLREMADDQTETGGAS